MEENICKSRNWKGVNIQNMQGTHTTQEQVIIIIIDNNDNWIF